MKKSASTIFSALLMSAASQQAQATEPVPVVLELFTSQGCSSCPPADALLEEIAKHPGIIALSFHVHYWNYLGWADPFSSEANSKRQSQYARNLQMNSVFTPQIMVNGSYSAEGNNSSKIGYAIAAARKDAKPVPITLSPDEATHTLNVHVAAATGVAAPSSVFAVRYQRHASTQIGSGENAGRTLTSINNVTEVAKLGAWIGKDSDFKVALGQNADEGIAVLLQNDGQGPIISAQNYQK